MMPLLRPVHLPLLVALLPVILTDAGSNPPDSLLTHLRPLATPFPSPPQTPPAPPRPPSTHPSRDSVVQFTKKLYRELGNNLGNATALTRKYQGEFDELDESTGGALAETLTSMFEIRMLELQASIRHARKMRQIIDGFTGKIVNPSSI